jgi:hypothetical protein
MTELTLDQILFLGEHGIPISSVFDATGMKRDEYRNAMKELGMIVAVGVNPCTAIERHTLKDKYGKCIQCKPHNLSFQKRYHESEFIYVARSESTGLIKIGVAKDTARREYSLNKIEYGRCNDWKIQFNQKCDKTARVEFDVHQSLQTYTVSRCYWRQGSLVHCSELFNCEVELAIKTIKDTILFKSVM